MSKVRLLAAFLFIISVVMLEYIYSNEDVVEVINTYDENLNVDTMEDIAVSTISSCDLCGNGEGCPPECENIVQNEQANSPKVNDKCEELWVCSQWSECKNGVQRRYCVDNNKCGTTNNKPQETRSCGVDNVLENDTSHGGENIDPSGNSYIRSRSYDTTFNEKAPNEEVKKERNTVLVVVGMLFFGLLSIISFAGLTIYVYKYVVNNNSSNNSSDVYENIETDDENEINRLSESPYNTNLLNTRYIQIKQWIKEAINSGLTDEQIISYLTQYGWDPQIVKALILEIRKSES